MHATATLVFETSTPQASVALVRADGSITRREFRSDRNHNAKLFAPLAELLHGSAGNPASASASEIGLVLVGSGPGSYSGTRVGIAAAQGIAITCACPCVAIPSILAVPAADNGAACLAIGDARRGTYWTAEINRHQLVTEPAICDAATLLECVTAAAEKQIPVFAFEAADRFPLPAPLQAAISHQFPDATLLWQAWQSSDEPTRAAWSRAVPQPLYLKPPHITKSNRPSLLR